ncbi:MAG: ribosomal protein [Rickettsiales bacterium]|jgi:large subunit ribosomal protein L29|nr:ribosomal protein [Rickettsiales bacterium]
MKIAELRSKTVDQLKAQLLDSKKELFNLRFQKATGELATVHRTRQVRRTVARIRTLLTEQKAGETNA